jgi:hypothetical protein
MFLIYSGIIQVAGTKHYKKGDAFSVYFGKRHETV